MKHGAGYLCFLLRFLGYKYLLPRFVSSHSHSHAVVNMHLLIILALSPILFRGVATATSSVFPSRGHHSHDLDRYQRGAERCRGDTSGRLGSSQGDEGRKASAKLGRRSVAGEHSEYGWGLRAISTSGLKAQDAARIQRRTDRRKKPQVPLLTKAQLRERARQQNQAQEQTGPQDQCEERGQERHQALQGEQNQETHNLHGHDGSSRVELKDAESNRRQSNEGRGSTSKVRSESSREEQDTSSPRSHVSLREGSESHMPSGGGWKSLREEGEKGTTKTIKLPVTEK